ncbi:MAG TPA: tetratricopeptide repeat protein [Thermoanaerobaculia bacterium]
MNRTKIVMLLAVAVLAARCTTTAPMPPAVTPEGEDRYLIDPRVGANQSLAAPEASRFEAAWRYILAGNEAEARRALGDVRMKAPDYLPLLVAEAAIDIRNGRLDEAREKVVQAQERVPEYTAARVYEAEIAVRERRTRVAYELYRDIAAQPNAPDFATARANELAGLLFNDLLAAAQSAPEQESIRLLREALAFNTAAIEPRILLAQKLLALKQFDEARKEVDPLLNVAADRAEVQEILAEVEVGRGRFQEAIVRYDRLARRTKNARYERRLEEIKQEWSSANMPGHYRDALNSAAITRSDLAILLYWTVPSIRFAQNLGAPPIAIDVDGPGRDEIIRAIAIGLFDVDPITRRVSPGRAVPASRFATHLARVLTLRGAPCAKGLSSDRVLAACGVTDPHTLFASDAGVPGRDAQRALEQVAKALQ